MHLGQKGAYGFGETLNVEIDVPFLQPLQNIVGEVNVVLTKASPVKKKLLRRISSMSGGSDNELRQLRPVRSAAQAIRHRLTAMGDGAEEKKGKNSIDPKEKERRRMIAHLLK